MSNYLLRSVVNPLSQHLYPMIGKMVDNYGFLVHYKAGGQRSLKAHFDSSDVTLNVCLGGDFVGGDLVFHNWADRVQVKLRHHVGNAVLHLGSNTHQANPILHGTRSNLILWCSRRSV